MSVVVPSGNSAGHLRDAGLRDRRLYGRRLFTKRIAGLCRTCVDRFRGSVRHNVLRGLAAYNAGLDQVFKFDGMPFIFQTVDYVRKIMAMYDQLIDMRKAR